MEHDSLICIYHSLTVTLSMYYSHCHPSFPLLPEPYQGETNSEECMLATGGGGNGKEVCDLVLIDAYFKKEISIYPMKNTLTIREP